MGAFYELNRKYLISEKCIGLHWHKFMLNVPETTPPRVLTFILVFIHSVIITRKQLLEEGNADLNTSILARIVSTYLEATNSLKIHPKKNPGIVPDSVHFLNAMKKRTSRLSKTAAKYLQATIEDYADDITIYTDGSSIPNPGPAGSGAFFVNFPGPGLEYSLSVQVNWQRG